MCEFSKKLKLHKPLWQVKFQLSERLIAHSKSKNASAGCIRHMICLQAPPESQMFVE